MGFMSVPFLVVCADYAPTPGPRKPRGDPPDVDREHFPWAVKQYCRAKSQTRGQRRGDQRGNMKIIVTLGALAAITTASVMAAEPMQPSPTCDRACLYRVLDDYLAARDAHDARKVRWAAHVKNTENNVELRPDDGLWGTITARDAYEMRFADPQTGQVAIFGVVQETKTRSPYATRLKVVDRAVAEAETIVVRPEDAGIPSSPPTSR